MNRLLAILVVTFLTSWTTRAQNTNNISTNEVVRLQVTVLDSVQLSDFKGFAIPAGNVDLRYALTLRIDSCTPAITNLKAGTVVTFAVHSPSLFLAGSAEKGTTHEISTPRSKAVNLAP